jgi:RNA polymerase sigma-70 factor (ECF subfamily)
LDTPAIYSEEELVSLLRQRDGKVFNYLYGHYAAALFAVVKSIIAEEETAKDVLQEVFVSIWKKIDLYDPSKGKLFTWMLNVARMRLLTK